MPNASVRAAGEGLPSFPQKADRFSFVRSLLTASPRARAMEPEHGDKIMNARINRRSLVAVATVSSTFPALAGSDDAGGLAELIADYRWKHEEWTQVCSELDTLLASPALPPDRIKVRWRVEYPGYIDFRTIVYRFKEEIDRSFGVDRGHKLSQKASRRRARALARLRRQHAIHEAAREALGINRLEHLEGEAFEARWQAHVAILKQRPATLAEAQMKDRFLLELLDQGNDFDPRQLRWVFSGDVA